LLIDTGESNILYKSNTILIAMLSAFRKGAVLTIGLLMVALLFLSIIPVNASAEPKSEIVTLSHEFSFSLQLKANERVYWDWSTTELIDFTIYDDDRSNYLVMVDNAASDKGNAMVKKEGTYVFEWEENVDGDLKLMYTVTYEPIPKGEWACCCSSAMVAIAALGIIAIAAAVTIKRKA
jgi:hypothetical protein